MANFFYVLPIFLAATLWLSFLTYFAPRSAGTGENSLRFPTSFEDVFKLSQTLKSYYVSNRVYMFCLFLSAYLYKQAFCIPGSAFLNMLGGAIFGLWPALPLCCVLTGVGATLSYALSRVFAEHLIVKFWPNEVNTLRHKIENNGDNLFFYLLSIRLMPFTPNWLLNLISPIVGVQLHLFFTSAFIGLIPYNYICVLAGSMIGDISSLEDVFTWKIMLQLAVLALSVLILPLFRNLRLVETK